MSQVVKVIAERRTQIIVEVETENTGELKEIDFLQA